MPTASRHTKTWELFRWGAWAVALVVGVVVGGHAYALVDKLFSVGTQGWGVPSAIVWFACTALAVNIAWLGVRLIGFLVDEALEPKTGLTREKDLPLDSTPNDDQ